MEQGRQDAESVSLKVIDCCSGPTRSLLSPAHGHDDADDAASACHAPGLGRKSLILSAPAVRGREVWLGWDKCSGCWRLDEQRWMQR